MLNEDVPKMIRPFLNQQVTVETKGGTKLQGLLIGVDRSGHGGCLGNLVLRNDNGDRTIVRGGALRLIAVVSKPELVDAHRQHVKPVELPG